MLLFLLRTPPSANDLDDSIIGLIFILPWILAIGFYFFKRATVTKWEQGIFPISLEYNRDNLLEAYICLAARMIQSDPREAGEKVLYMNRYFKQHFPNAHYDFGESLSFSYRNPIQINTVSKWLMLKLPLRKQRLQIMYFLAGISFVDGALNRKELGILQELSDLLGLSPKEFDSIISMYTRRERRSSQQNTTKSKDYYIKLACRVLGVSEHASMEEIKKAYRSLVKKHHPDLFADQSAEQQEIAEQRFLEIQKAYELLEKYK